MSNVDHPNHYNAKGKKECIVEMEDNFGATSTITFCLMNSYKYLYRKGLKENNPIEQDLEKAKWYFNYANKLINKYEYCALLKETLLYADVRELLEGSN